MRVLHLDSGRDLRGGQIQVELLVAGLARTPGVEQRVLAAGELRRRLATETLSIGAVARSTRWADVIHAHDARTHTLAAALRGAKPLVVSRRVAFAPRAGFAGRWKYRRADLFLAVSEHVRERLLSVGIAADRVRVVHDGVEPPAEEPRFRPAEGSLRVLALDSEDPGKGSALARESCRLAGLSLTLTRDLSADLPRHDAFLYLSSNEGLGSALIAAAMRKIPAVASRVGGIPEIVQHEQTGLLVANDAAEVSRALLRLQAEPDLARRLAEAAFQRAGAEFAADIMVARTLEAYRSLIDS